MNAIDCLGLLATRIQEQLSDISEIYLTAPRLPDQDGGVKTVQVIKGWPDLENRDKSVLPFISARPTSLTRPESGRQVQMQLAAVNWCESSADFEWPWILLAQLELGFSEKPYLGDGIYQMLMQSWDVREGQDIRETWGWNAAVATLDIKLPEIEQIYGPDGKRLRLEDEYA